MPDYERLFAVNFYKNKKLLLAEMSFSKPLEAGKRGNAYPKLSDASICGDLPKSAEMRYFCRYFPYASYEMTVCGNGEWGFGFCTPDGMAAVTVKRDGGMAEFVFCDGAEEKCTDRSICEIFKAASEGDIKDAGDSDAQSESLFTFIITARKQFLDVYVKDDRIRYVTTFETSFTDITKETVFSQSYAAVLAADPSAFGTSIVSVSSYMDCGISQADLRAVRYENGDVLMENGKVFVTFSARMQEGAYQGVFSWVPGTMEFELIGCVFFDAGDGHWQNDVATSLKKNRQTGKWNLWVCSFSHDHVLGHAEFDGDIRYGVSVVDLQLMNCNADDPAAEMSISDTAFSPKFGDEDPDFIYDEITGKWYMCICRLKENCGYRYYVFRGDGPFECNEYIGHTADGEATGGTLLFKENEEGERMLTLTCGANFDVTSDYREYVIKNLSIDGMNSEFTNYHPITFDFPDGGFRGWGNVIRIPKGTRTEEYLLTFDRSLGSSWNWSYGTIYCFKKLH